MCILIGGFYNGEQCGHVNLITFTLNIENLIIGLENGTIYAFFFEKKLTIIPHLKILSHRVRAQLF